MVRGEAYPVTSSDEEDDDTAPQPPAPRSKPAPAPAPAPPAPAPVPAPAKKKKTLNRQVYVSNEDPDAALDPAAAAPPAEKKKTPVAGGGAAAGAPTPAPQSKKRDVVAGEVAPSKSSLVSARSCSGDEDDGDDGDDGNEGEEASTTGLFVGVNSAATKPTKPETVADEDGSEDDDAEDTNNEFGDSVSARTEEPQAATPTPHPKPQQPTTSAADSAAAPVVKKTEEFLTELLESVQFLTRGTKKKKSSQRVNMFSFSEHLKDESLSLTKAEFALDPAVPVELAGALTTPCNEGMDDDDDGKRKTIKSIDMPFDVFLSGDEDKFFANLCEQDPWARQKIMAASIIATKESETPKQFCYFVRLNITAPRDTEEEPNAEAVAAWPAFETFMGEEKREVVLSVAETVVKAAMKQLQDAVFFCPQQFISAYTPARTRGKAKASSATAEPAAKTHVYKRFEQINDKVIALAFNITGGPVPKKRSASTKAAAAASKAAAAPAGPKQKTLVQLANRQAETASKQGRRLVAHAADDDEEEDDDDDECQRPPASKKSKLAAPAPAAAPVANDVLMNDGDDDEEESIDTCEVLIAGLAREIATKQKTMKLLKEFHKYLAER